MPRTRLGIRCLLAALAAVTLGGCIPEHEPDHQWLGLPNRQHYAGAPIGGYGAIDAADGSVSWAVISDVNAWTRIQLLLLPGTGVDVQTWKLTSSFPVLLGWRQLEGHGNGSFFCPAGGRACTFEVPLLVKETWYILHLRPHGTLPFYGWALVPSFEP